MIDLLVDIEQGSPKQHTIDSLMRLKLDNLPYDTQQLIKKRSTFIFATNDDKDNHNCQELAKISSNVNPLACLNCKTINKTGKFRSRHFDKSTPLKTAICVGSRVAIKGKNIEPNWGIYNGSIGIVREIVFKGEDNPNRGDLPLYVSVELFDYKPPDCVPIFDRSNPKVSTYVIYRYQTFIHSFQTNYFLVIIYKRSFLSLCVNSNVDLIVVKFTFVLWL